jgi:1-acyl-sn-glycerol-3-phosphate acyltransferase
VRVEEEQRESAPDLAPMRAQVYADPRPKEHFDRFHERSRTREPDWAYELTRLITSSYAHLLLRARAISSENVPGRGAVILAPNHFSFMDHFLMGCGIRRKVRFMAKSQLFKRPMQFIYTHGGVFPVRRGARDEETFVTAETILKRGGAVAMYCEGGRSRTGRLAERAKPGIGRLALSTGVPVIPIAIHGSSHIRNWKRLRLPKVTIQYGKAIRWERVPHPTREQQQAVADAILDEIKALYGGLQEHGRSGVLRRVREQRRGGRRASSGAATA